MTDPVAGVERWLDKQGYPLEFEVARTFAKAGFRTWQGIHFRDTESTEERTREIDVVAVEWPEGIESKRAGVEFVIEVKFTHEPWLVLTTQLPTRPESLKQYFLMTDSAAPVVSGLLANPPVPTILSLPDRHGFNVVQTVADRDPTRPNPAYVALTNVVKAAHAQLKLTKKHGTRIYFPVIVVGGALLQLGYSADGSRILEPVVWQRIRWQGSSVVGHPVLVDIVQKDHLPIWAANARKDAMEIDEPLEGWVTPGHGLS